MFYQNGDCFVHWFHWHWFQVKLILVCFSTMLSSKNADIKISLRLYSFTTWLLHLSDRTREGEVATSEGQVWVLRLYGNLAVPRQGSGQQSACLTVQTADLSAKRLLCRERIRTYALVVWSCRLLPLGTRLRLGSSLSLPKNFRTTQDRSFSSLLKSCWS